MYSALFMHSKHLAQYSECIRHFQYTSHIFNFCFLIDSLLHKLWYKNRCNLYPTYFQIHSLDHVTVGNCHVKTSEPNRWTWSSKGERFTRHIIWPTAVWHWHWWDNMLCIDCLSAIAKPPWKITDHCKTPIGLS